MSFTPLPDGCMWNLIEICRAVAGEKSSSFKAIGPVILEKTEHMVGWLFWFKRPFETVFQSISGRLPERGRKKRERTEQGKMFEQTPPAPTASAKGPFSTIIQIVGRPALEVYSGPSRDPTTARIYELF